MKADKNTEKKLQLYRERMQEIVYRLDVVEAFIRGDRNALYMPTTVESIYLQFRNVLELIATASLVMNDSAMNVLQQDGWRTWHAGDILDVVEMVNPTYFYPIPTRLVERNTSNQKVGVDGYRGEFEDFKGDYLTREKFSTLYDICSKTVHIPSLFDKRPYIKSEKKCKQLLKQASGWRQRTIALVMHHRFMLAGDDDTMFVVYTGENAIFHTAIFTKMKTVDKTSSAEEIARVRAEMLKSSPQNSGD